MTQRKTNDAEELDNRFFFEHFYEQHKQFLYYVARRRCHNEDDVQEVVQEKKQTNQNNDADYITQSIPTQSGKVAKIIIPIDAAEDDLYMIKDMLDIVLKRKFKLSDI